MDKPKKHSKNLTHDDIARNRLAILKDKKIGRTWHDNEWWYVVEDVVFAFAGSKDPQNYILRMKLRDPELGKGWGQIVFPLPIETADGFQKMNCANMEGIFRIIQSIPAPRPEPYKQWLARVGYERILEFGNPETAAEHPRGYARPGGIRALGSKNVSGQTNNLEAILSILVEAATNEIARNLDLQGVCKSNIAAEKAGRIADEVREKVDAEADTNISGHRNCLEGSDNRKENL